MLDLKDVLPWGRSLEEYRRMFSLSDDDLSRRILGCADGPAAFNEELTASGGSVVSCDPIYQFSIREIRQRIEVAETVIVQQTRSNTEMFSWSDGIPDPEALSRHRRDTMDRFLADFDAGRNQGRYLNEELPLLPLEGHTFDIGLCSHFLFLYSDHLGASFHVQAVRRLVQLAPDVRIFPVTDLANRSSKHLEPVMSAVRDAGHSATIQDVDYDFLKGCSRMLRITR